MGISFYTRDRSEVQDPPSAANIAGQLERCIADEKQKIVKQLFRLVELIDSDIQQRFREFENHRCRWFESQRQS